MNEWTKAQEADFKKLIYLASEQSRECYRRRQYSMTEPSHMPKAQEPVMLKLPAPAPAPVPVPPPKASPKQAGGKTSPVPPKQSSATRSVNRLAGLGELLDNEGIMLMMLLWLLIEEKADKTIIIAIAYILLV